MNAIVPIPRCSMTVRPAVAADVPFMDRLQKLHGKALGYFPTKQFEGYVQSGGVLIAEDERGAEEETGRQGETATRREDQEIQSPSRQVALSPGRLVASPSVTASPAIGISSATSWA